jgi:hypothetical protein
MLDFYVQRTEEAGNADVDCTIQPQIITAGGDTFCYSITPIRYDHIPWQVLPRTASIRCLGIDLKKTGKRIGYIMGAGDEVPAALRKMDYEVEILAENRVNAASLKTFDAVVIGIRAYNTHAWLKKKKPELMAYLQDGGRVVAQYNNASFLAGGPESLDSIAPYPLKISQERITVENSPVKILAPENHLLQKPNRITEKDFEGWVQERAVYLPKTWDAKFTPLLTMQEPIIGGKQEEPKNGALLAAPVGKGLYIYTSIAFFRELPAGVPGAYRLFANLVSK